MSQKSDQQQSSEMDLNALSCQIESSSSSVTCTVAEKMNKPDEDLEVEIVDIADKVEDIQRRAHEICE